MPFQSAACGPGCLPDRSVAAAIPPAAVLRLGRDLAAAVQHLHSRGILHCNLKPSNILLDGASDDLLFRGGVMDCCVALGVVVLLVNSLAPPALACHACFAASSPTIQTFPTACRERAAAAGWTGHLSAV